jgi:hypothetical protein
MMINFVQSFLLAEALKEGDVDAVGPLDGETEDPGPDAVGKAAQSAGNTEHNSVEVVLSHA